MTLQIQPRLTVKSWGDMKAGRNPKQPVELCLQKQLPHEKQARRKRASLLPLILQDRDRKEPASEVQENEQNLSFQGKVTLMLEDNICSFLTYKA